VRVGINEVNLDVIERYPLNIDAAVLESLRRLRDEVKFTDLPGYNTEAEQARCSGLVDELLDRVTQGIQENPRKSWVLEQCVSTLEAACSEDTEARERFGQYLERLMDIVGISSSDGMLNFYLAFGGVQDD
jgi:hypothetical protein